MFSHRGLFLAVTISLASIALAGVLYQPEYEHQCDSNPRYLQDQSAPQYWTQSPIEQYRAKQLSDQESTRYRPGVQTVYPYESNQVNARSSEPDEFPGGVPGAIIAFPLYVLYRLLYQSTEENKDPKEDRRETVREYERDRGENILIHINGGRHFLPLMVHNRRKRSDPASTESEVVAHDNDVAAKSPSTDAKHPTTIDSLLPEHEPTDTTDNRVENRRIRNDYITNPRSFGFYTEDTHPEHTYNIPNKWQSMINQYYTNRHSEDGSEPPNVAQGEACCDGSKYRDNGSDSASDSTSDTVKETAKWFGALYTSLLNKSQYIRPVRPGHMYGVPQRKTRYYMEEACGRAAHHEPEKKSLQEITNMKMISTAEPSQDKTLQIPFYSEMAATPTSVQSQPPFVTYMQNPYRSNEKLSAINEIVGAPYDTNDRPSPSYNFYYLCNYPRYWNNDWGNAERIEDSFIQLKKKNDTTSTNAPNPNRGFYVPLMPNYALS
ncbi:uncharacterized protein [Temnothorax nylanderi]|uniref:uncharacterized protein n=1 Tax=Temnothorax nylanderi TaxID=102681 RepID=UPI003A89DF70